MNSTSTIPLVITISVLPLLIIAPGNAITLKESFNQSTALLSGASTINALTIIDILPENQLFNLSSNFSESGFTSNVSSSINGIPFVLSQTGILSGEDGSNIVIDISSSGNIGSDIISSNARMRFSYDFLANEYTSFEYHEQGEVNPLFGWIIRGSLSLLRGPGGRIASLLGLGTAKLYTPEPPLVTPLPPPPNNPIPIKPVGSKMTITIEEKDKICTTIIEDPIYSKNCTIGTDNISAEFITASVPEPTSTLGLFSLGILGVGATIKRQVKRNHSIEKETTKIG